VSKKKHKRPFSLDAKPGRNAPCTCGSGKKSKKCCYAPFNPPALVPYGSMRAMVPIAAAFEMDQAFVRRWGYHPGLAERSAMVDGSESEMVNMVLRKLAALNAHPRGSRQ
jgi:hypothetical protein